MVAPMGLMDIHPLNAGMDEQKIMESLNDFHYLKVFPNPAKDYLIIEYILESAQSNAILQLTDMSGKILSTYQLNNKQDQQIIDTRVNSSITQRHKTNGTKLLSTLHDNSGFVLPVFFVETHRRINRNDFFINVQKGKSFLYDGIAYRLSKAVIFAFSGDTYSITCFKSIECFKG